MKALIITCLFLLSACAGTTCPPVCPSCPPEKAYYPTGSSDYGILMWGTMNPGYFDLLPDGTKNWLTEKEYEDLNEEDEEAEKKLEI